MAEILSCWRVCFPDGLCYLYCRSVLPEFLARASVGSVLSFAPVAWFTLHLQLRRCWVGSKALVVGSYVQ